MFEIIKNKKMMTIVITTILLSAAGYAILYINNQKNEIINEIVSTEEQETSSEEEIKSYVIVDIGGEINIPGVYQLEEGARINDLVTMAGGVTAKACLDNVNLAYKLSDGMKIMIPQKEVKKAVTSSTVKPQTIQSSAIASAEITLININTATIEQLDKLEGIGEATAKKIIEYREGIGGFKKKEELMNVSGIGETKYSNIKDEIEV